LLAEPLDFSRLATLLGRIGSASASRCSVTLVHGLVVLPKEPHESIQRRLGFHGRFPITLLSIQVAGKRLSPEKRGAILRAKDADPRGDQLTKQGFSLGILMLLIQDDRQVVLRVLHKVVVRRLELSRDRELFPNVFCRKPKASS